MPFDALARDVRYAARVLRRSPGFTLTAVLTLALTIGANTAIFSIVDALLLRPLPYPAPERLAIMATRVDSASGGTPWDQTAQDGRSWEAARDHLTTSDRAAYSGRSQGVNLATSGGALYVQNQRVGAGYFRVLGVRPLMGREFDPADDRPKGPPLAILSCGLWQTLFGADPGIVGKTVQLRGEAYTVIGVMPAAFRGSAPAELWTPLRPSLTGEGEGANYTVILRLRDGSTWAQANGELAALAPELDRGRRLEAGVRRTPFAMPLQEGLTEGVRRPLVILWAAVGVVLLIACINIAGLMLARGAARAREIATRLAIGSGRAAIVRQLVVESVVLAALGGAGGLLVGLVALDALSEVARQVFNIWEPLRIDGRVLAASGIITLTSALVFGFAPAFHLARLDAQPALAEHGARGATAGSRWTRRAVIVAEVALGVVLLVSAGLLVRTFLNLRGLDPGFDVRGVVAATVSLDDVRYRDPAAVARVFDSSLARIRELPGVDAAAVSLGVPYQRMLNIGFRLPGGTPEAAKGAMTNMGYVTPGFFEALRIPVRSGRVFDARGAAGRSTALGTSTRNVAVVNTSFVRRYLGSADPIGRRMLISNGEREIVAVVGDVQVSNPGWGGFGPIAAPPMVYVPITQMQPGFVGLVHTWFSPVWIVRSSRSLQDLEPLIRAAVAGADPQLPVAKFERMEDVMGLALARQRFMALLLVALGGLAALLSAIGIHGLIAASVTERTREIGIRMALGATAAHAMRTVASTGVRLAVAGVVLGAVASGWTVRLLRSQLWGVEPGDPVTFAGVVGLLLLVAAVASIVPALRILRLDPAETLRAE